MKPNKFYTFAILLCFFIASCYESQAIPVTPSAVAALLQEHTNEPLVVILYRTDCPWCRRELAELPDIMAECPNSTVEYLGIALDNSASDLDYYLRSNTLPFAPYWLDYSSIDEFFAGFSDAGIKLPQKFGVPLLILLDSQHEQQYTLVGYQQKESLLEKLESL